LNYWKFSLVCLAGAFFAMASCSHPPSSGTTSGNGGSGGNGSTCSGSPGSLGCPCNGTTCDQGLSCASIGNNGENECVSTGSGTGGMTGSGGTTGGGGNVAAGGSTGSGGSSTSGSGGTAATGGSTGSGGSPSTGGSTGSGGSSPGNNLITNGDFSQGMTDWGIPNGSPTSSGVENGQFCVTLGSGSVIVGWGDSSTSFNLMANVSYTLSYQVSTTSPLGSFDVHVGEVVSPYTQDYPSNGQPIGDNPSNNMQTFTHMFSVTNGDSQAGLAFVLSAGNGSPKVCIDNVSVTQN
jgi:hypothetical protein